MPLDLINFDTSVSPRNFVVSPNTTTTELQRVVLSCQVSAHPTPVIRWLKRTSAEQIQVLTNSSRVLVGVVQEETIMFSHRSTIVIQNTQSSDSGEYMCVAENIATVSPILSPTIFVTINGEI